MKSKLLFSSLFTLVTMACQAQQTCEVTLESITGTYTGDCSNGKANGEGKSVGADTYEGTFKNGVPNGMGKYTWKNGDYYLGEWKKGMKDGKGEIHKTADGKETVTKGYWKKDVYKGQSLKPYSIHDATTEIGRVEVTKIRDGGGSITIEVHSMSGGLHSTTQGSDGVHQGTEVKAETTNISLKEIRVQAGSYDSKATNMLTNKEVTVIKNVLFPFRATFVFGSSSTVDIEIFDEGDWSVSVPVQN